MSEWISVHDRLPDADGEYLVVIQDEMILGRKRRRFISRFVALFNAKYKTWIIRNTVCVKVTHWTMLPELPV